MNKVIIPVCAALISPIAIYLLFSYLSLPHVFAFILSSCVVWILLGSTIWVTGLDASEKSFVINIIRSKVFKRLTHNEQN